MLWNARGRVLNEELYAQKFQKVIYLHLFTGCFMKISLQSYEPIQFTFIYLLCTILYTHCSSDDKWQSIFIYIVEREADLWIHCI